MASTVLSTMHGSLLSIFFRPLARTSAAVNGVDGTEDEELLIADGPVVFFVTVLVSFDVAGILIKQPVVRFPMSLALSTRRVAPSEAISLVLALDRLGGTVMVTLFVRFNEEASTRVMCPSPLSFSMKRGVLFAGTGALD